MTERKLTDISQITMGGKPVVTKDIEREILQMWNRQLFEDGIIPEQLYEMAISKIEKL